MDRGDRVHRTVRRHQAVQERQLARQRHLYREAAEWSAAMTGRGRWVEDAKMHPTTNVQNRIYRDRRGRLWRARQFPLIVPAEAWFFPDLEPEQGAHESTRSAFD